MSNSDNPKNGAAFQKAVKVWFENKYNQIFVLEKRIAIGKPPKDHKFDIACDRLNIVTFLESYDLSGKEIVLFATSGSTGLGSSVEDLEEEFKKIAEKFI